MSDAHMTRPPAGGDITGAASASIAERARRRRAHPPSRRRPALTRLLGYQGRTVTALSAEWGRPGRGRARSGCYCAEPTAN